MHWNSPWSEGFPGWHLECSAMGTKYLGETFDIHGGGMDLVFPHHECEIAQSSAALGHETVRYWIHNNMITINGQKMGKSLGNFITLDEFFAGTHSLVSQRYSPMTIRFFILQAHYRSTVDFSNEALVASQKGLERLVEAYERLQKISVSDQTSVEISDLRQKCEQAMNDDLNTPVVISHLFEASKAINTVYDGNGKISERDLDELKSVFQLYMFDVLGLKTEQENSKTLDAYKKAIDLLLNMRLDAKRNKDWELSDKIRNELSACGFIIKDTKEGFEWSI
jgi:cysteinyl-tRNA synthetase